MEEQHNHSNDFNTKTFITKSLQATNGNILSIDTLIKLLELLTTDQEEVLVNVTTILRLAYNVPMQPLKFHTQHANDYVSLIELIASDNEIITTNVLSILTSACREGTGLCAVLHSSSALASVLPQITPTIKKNRALQQFITTALSAIHNVLHDATHINLQELAIQSKLYMCAFKCCHQEYHVQSSTFQLLDVLGDLTEIDSSISIYIWLNIELISLHSGLTKAVSEVGEKKNKIGKCLRIVRNITDTVRSSKQLSKKRKHETLIRQLPIRVIHAIVECMTTNNNDASLGMNHRGEQIFNIGLDLLWSISMMDEQKKGDQITKRYGLPVVTPLVSIEQFGKVLLLDNEHKKRT